MREIIYEGVLRGAQTALRAAAPFNEKLRRGLAGRADAVDQLRRWSLAERRPERPLVWFHAPSVGEALMAQAIVGALREQRPELQIAFTHFSPSAQRMRDRVGADVATYMPWDTAAEMREVLDLLQPSALTFVRTEIWPTLVRLARERSLPVALVNGVLSERSSRLRPLARLALSPAYQQLHVVGAIDAATALRFKQLGVSEARTRVTGDARFDQVWRRVQSLERTKAFLQRLRDPGRTTIVAGSTWPGDEERLLPVFLHLANTRLIIAPHEPTEAHLQALEQALAPTSISCARLAAVEARSDSLPGVVLVDRVGVLADLYALADIAYVGGAFQHAGVHSVVEPAALGVPVVTGPRHFNAVEAGELIAAGGGVSVADTADLVRTFERLLDDAQLRREMGTAARTYVESKLGGARANAALIEALLADKHERIPD